MSHLKREQSPKSWPTERKGSAYLVRPRHNIEKGVPVLIAIRDMLHLAKDRKEVKHTLNSKQIILNHRPIFDDKDTMQLFDILTILPSQGNAGKNYRLVIGKNKKFALAEISNAEANHKVAKIINKKTLKGNKIQVNLSDGRNFISEMKCNTNDSILINLKDKKPEKCLPLKKGEKAFVIAGKYAGEKGVIAEVNNENKMIKLESGKNAISILIKQIMVLE